MIYILSGNDIKKKNTFLKKLYKDNVPLFISDKDLSKDLLFEQAQSNSLFGEKSVMVLDGLVKQGDINLSSEDLLMLKDSETIFVFLEEKLLVADVKKYKKFATIEDFSSLVIKKISKVNVFGIADKFSLRDKIGTWVSYREAISAGIPPEEISGIIFWKVKTMLLNKNKIFKKEELKKYSSQLVALYHKSHNGEVDFVIGLEQFILSSLHN